ncbi:hypothetical protein Poly51_56420 [Rubripirellula tenax]|uniref:Uncharacterized protein n=1 Tax=Rubripirellula tenax TaxID=2528015 RepID=A0A5C6EF79_9BACT|nr:hypothetical protein Poly51_56420 [Rubripirellula tenax]
MIVPSVTHEVGFSAIAGSVLLQIHYEDAMVMNHSRMQHLIAITNLSYHADSLRPQWHEARER